MVIDGKAIAIDILESVATEVTKLSRAPRMDAVTCAPNFETKKYLQMKKQKATSVGIVLKVTELSVDSTTEDIIRCVKTIAKESDGIVIQLPLPNHIDREKVLAEIPVTKDPDGFYYGSSDLALMPPVVGAIDEISRREKIDWRGKQVVIMGMGRLVGIPATQYAKQAGAIVSVLTKDTYDENILSKADIVVSGIGQPHFIKPENIKEGVVIFDAGTSEEGGVLMGDVDPRVASKASLLTPVPGGIGPITIAYLLRNLVELVRQ
jgi:methylenetetrahydrofolate dehydrogenase (NADP+)/methenyltetrahydrofolate cyclohydrolase